ncbi:iron complex transport system permease protein [Pelagirhabdus alkalitolerans]|uniref:Iron complex transport system permease protein n=1 Tax=Pelagirhabdus alkalitolerans TaxID=1612202 RepID=A0A1G6J127_9BACI|nr:iron ABC transporter permease [Pelagirhabdus alkalitolerans]SDC12421.1 iron complex transport system permease protein [Pelagirhabdus alkalitolerans]
MAILKKYTQVDTEDVIYQSRPVIASIIIMGGLFGLIVSIGISVSFGAADIDMGTVWSSIVQYNDELTSHQIIQEIRLPRVLGAALVGACFAVSGSIMQGITRNPLADSGLLGLNAGAAFMLAISFAFFPGMPYMYIIFFSFAGAALGAGLVFGIGSMTRGGLKPVRLVLAGAAVSALLIALSEGIAIYYRISQDLAFWHAGGVSGTKWENLEMVAPLVIVAFLGAMSLSKSITIISLGEEIAIGLGQRTKKIKFFLAIIVLILAGIGVSIVGAVGFVGLIIPHITRFLVGHDYRWIIPCSAILGGLLVVLADFGARMINPPLETPIGALIALLGVPFFLYLARKGGEEI